MILWGNISVYFDGFDSMRWSLLFYRIKYYQGSVVGSIKSLKNPQGNLISSVQNLSVLTVFGFPPIHFVRYDIYFF